MILVDTSLIRSILSRLSKGAFESFIIEMFSDKHEPIELVEGFDEGIYYAPLLDSYGGTLHTVYITHYLPIELFRKPTSVDIADPIVVERVRRVRQHYKGKKGYFGMVSPALRKADALQSLAFLTNFANISRDEYDRKLFPKYRELLKDVGINVPMFLGSFDSFIELSPEKTKTTLERFITKHSDGLTIQLSEERISINRYSEEKVLLTGVLAGSGTPCEPVFISPALQEPILAEFEALLRAGTKEEEIEKFLKAHYKDVFGPNYDRIETQLWLRFPDLDISGKQRRIDIFLRNSVLRDWDLFEIKRVVNLTRTYRDIPVFRSEIFTAIQQLRNYAKILSQDTVRKKLAEEGIEYYHPSLNLVIGHKPQIPHRQWRWLKSTNEKDLKIITFDELLEEMKVRLQYRSRIIG